MAENSKIEWCDHTVNLWWGCVKVHAGCDNCYAEKLANRFGDNIWGVNSQRKRIKSSFKDLEKYQKAAKREGIKYKVFVGSMMDIFEKNFSIRPSQWYIEDGFVYTCTSDIRHKFFQNIGKGMYPNLIFLFLTKRPSNIGKFIPALWITNPPSNVWFGCSVSNQSTFDNLVPKLLKVNGNKFLSIEPQISSISIESILVNGMPQVFPDWIIQGGESGHGKRHFDVEWARNMRDECEFFMIPYFFKQIDKKQEIPEDLKIRQFPKF
jgi:protein gp37